MVQALSIPVPPPSYANMFKKAEVKMRSKYETSIFRLSEYIGTIQEMTTWKTLNQPQSYVDKVIDRIRSYMKEISSDFKSTVIININFGIKDFEGIIKSKKIGTLTEDEYGEDSYHKAKIGKVRVIWEDYSRASRNMPSSQIYCKNVASAGIVLKTLNSYIPENIL